jgi:hypothetical protein
MRAHCTIESIDVTPRVEAKNRYPGAIFVSTTPLTLHHGRDDALSRSAFISGTTVARTLPLSSLLTK